MFLFDLWSCRGRPSSAHLPREPENCWEDPVFGSGVSWVWSHQVQRPDWYVSAFVLAFACISTLPMKKCTFCFSCVASTSQSQLKVWLLSFCFSPEEEFRSTYLNPLLSQWTLHRPMKPASPAQGPAPASWDWRDHGAVSSVKNQVRTNRSNYRAVTLNNMLLMNKWHLLPTSCWLICVFLAGYVWILLGIFCDRQHWRTVVPEKWDAAVPLWAR